MVDDGHDLSEKSAISQIYKNEAGKNKTVLSDRAPSFKNHRNYSGPMFWTHHLLKASGIISLAMVFGGMIGVGLRLLIKFLSQ